MLNNDIMKPIEPTPPEYYLFKEYSRGVKDFLNKVLYLKRFPREKNVNIFYSTPRVAWAKYVNPIVNGSAPVPVCSFHLDSFQIKQNEIMSGFVRKYTPNSLNSNIIDVDLSPSIWELTFKATIWTKTMDDMDNLVTQILIFTMPPKLWAFKIDDVWAEIKSNSVSIEDDLEPADTKDKTYRRSISLTIPRAYLPRESWTVGIIKEINLRFEEEFNYEEINLEGE